MGAVSQEYFASIGYDTNKLKPGELPPWMDGIDRTDQPVYANPTDKTPYWPSTPPGMDPQDPNAVQWSPFAPGTQQNTPTTNTTPVQQSGSGGTPTSGVTQFQPPAGDVGYQAPQFGQVTAPGMTGPMADAFRARIMELLGTPLNLDPDALRKTPENRAYRLGAQRSEERQRAQLAEESAAQGWSDSGGFDTSLAAIRQQRGEGEAAFMGQLATQYMQRQREQLYQGIQFAMSQGQFDAAQQMQAQLANLDAALKTAQLNEQGRQFDLGLGFDYTQLGVQGNQNAYNSLYGG